MVGCGHAQLPLLLAANRLVDAGHSVTALNSSPYLYYPGMSPGYLGNSYAVENLKVNVAQLAGARGVNFLSTKIEHIDIKAQTILTDSATVRYDLAAINLGSRSALSSFTHIDRSALYVSIFPAKPTGDFLPVKERIEECFMRAHQLGKTQIISIVGGGAAAVEIASNISIRYKQFCATNQLAPLEYTDRHTDPGLVQIRIFTPESILSRYSTALRRHTARILRKRGVDIIRARITHLYADALQAAESDGGARYPSRLTIVAAGITPPPLLRSAGFSVSRDGAVRVNRYLQSLSSASVFVAGDCAHFTPRPLPRVGVYAVRQGNIIRDNVLAYAALRSNQARRSPPNQQPSQQPLLPSNQQRRSPQLVPFRPQRYFFFSLNMGAGYGIASKYHFTWKGKSAFNLKDRFDREFITRYNNSVGSVSESRQ